MNIEKVYSNRIKEPLPGIIDILFGNTSACYHDYFVKHISKYYGKDILHKLLSAGVSVGTKFGTSGIEINQLLVSNDTDTVFEMCALTYKSLTARQKSALANFNIVVHEFMEGGYFVEDCAYTTATGSLDSVPMFMLCTLANSYETNNISTNFPDYNPKMLGFIPVHKPRDIRLEVLEQVDQAGLLEQCAWSLYLTDDDTGTYGNFSNSPNLSSSRWKTAPTHPFVKRHRAQLPKVLDKIETFAECLPLSIEHHGKYKWHVACETYQDRFFVSEKTFKCFIGGHVPLTVAPAGFNKFLTELGFVMPGDYDKLSGNDRVHAIVEIMKHDKTDYTDVAEHNFKLITDTDCVSSIFSQRIITAYKKALTV